MGKIKHRNRKEKNQIEESKILSKNDFVLLDDPNYEFDDIFESY